MSGNEVRHLRGEGRGELRPQGSQRLFLSIGEQGDLVADVHVGSESGDFGQIVCAGGTKVLLRLFNGSLFHCHASVVACGKLFATVKRECDGLRRCGEGATEKEAKEREGPQTDAGEA